MIYCRKHVRAVESITLSIRGVEVNMNEGDVLPIQMLISEESSFSPNPNYLVEVFPIFPVSVNFSGRSFDINTRIEMSTDGDFFADALTANKLPLKIEGSNLGMIHFHTKAEIDEIKRTRVLGSKSITSPKGGIFDSLGLSDAVYRKNPALELNPLVRHC